MQMFPTEDSTIRLSILKSCCGMTPLHAPIVKAKGVPRPERKGYRCKNTVCRQYYYSVKVGTIVEKSKIPLRKWLYAMYLVVTARKGIVAYS